MDIIVTGYAGTDGAGQIYNDTAYRKKLLEQYHESFFVVFDHSSETTEAMQKLYEARHEAGLAERAGEGGFLAALWRLMKENRTGGFYSLRKIPVLQQTVELCECFGLDPYRLYAPSCILWLTEDAGPVLEAAAAAGIPAEVIGCTAAGKAVRRIDNEETAYLRRPEPDELGKVFPGWQPEEKYER